MSYEEKTGTPDIKSKYFTVSIISIPILGLICIVLLIICVMCIYKKQPKEDQKSKKNTPKKKTSEKSVHKLEDTSVETINNELNGNEQGENVHHEPPLIPISLPMQNSENNNDSSISSKNETIENPP